VAKPTCGQQNATVDSDLTTIAWIVALLGTVITVIIKSQSIAAWLIAHGLGLGIPLAAAGGALIAFGIVLVMFYNRCTPQKGVQACSSGVINEIVPAFDSDVDAFFKFAAMHDRVDVVIKSVYWDLAQNNVFVRCAGDPEGSPMIAGYFYTKKVCDAGTGAVVGGAIAVGPAVAAGIALGLAIGCATVILCLLAILVAALVAAAIVIAGAVAGGYVGAELSDDTTASAGGVALSVGDYVTTMGNLMNVEFLDGARAYWWVRDATLHGRSAGSRPFSYLDPDANLTWDACPTPGPVIT
jgi:hypothetical protein